VVVSDQSSHFSGPLVGEIFWIYLVNGHFLQIFVVSSEKSCWLRGRKKMIISSKEKYYYMMIVFLNSCFENIFLCQKKQ